MCVLWKLTEKTVMTPQFADKPNSPHKASALDWIYNCVSNELLPHCNWGDLYMPLNVAEG